ncbi:MAG: undecaprenyldiphospho-muramoylpentapeptide beta-N-acetylglucosaminyltransferase [bacterium]
MRIIITGGGTLGHIYPGLAIADKLREKDEILFIGTTTGIESEVIQKEGFKFKAVDVQGWSWKDQLRFIIKLIVAFFVGIKYLKEFKPDVVVGMGGYASVPIVLGAVLLKIKTVIHEQNLIPGKATRLLAKFVDKVAINFAQSRQYLPTKKIEVTGNPIRALFGQISRQEAVAKFGLDEDKFTLLIFGGSRGAHRINEVMMAGLNLLPEDKIQIIWATGEKDYQPIKEFTSKIGLKIVVEKFFYDLPIAYQSSDLVVCRAGATTLAEIIACNLPAILIPYPYATDNHQEHNAKLLVEKGAAVMIKESELSTEKLTKTIIELVQNRDKLHTMTKNYQSFKVTDATQNVINVIYSLIS